MKAPSAPGCPREHALNRARKLLKNQREKTRKRRETLLRKADDFHKLCDTDVYMVLYKQNKFYVYTSQKNKPAWPPALTEIVRASTHLGEGKLTLLDARIPGTEYIHAGDLRSAARGGLG
jgi:hypothetical protein